MKFEIVQAYYRDWRLRLVVEADVNGRPLYLYASMLPHVASLWIEKVDDRILYDKPIRSELELDKLRRPRIVSFPGVESLQVRLYGTIEGCEARFSAGCKLSVNNELVVRDLLSEAVTIDTLKRKTEA